MLKSVKIWHGINRKKTVHYHYQKTFRLFCAGGSLHDMITNSPEILKQSAPDFTLQILEGLIYLHTESPQFIIHGDLKSQNVFLTENRSVLKIGDLDGHIRMKGPQTLLSDVSTPVGTPCFMSPEMVLFSISKKARVPIGRRTGHLEFGMHRTRHGLWWAVDNRRSDGLVNNYGWSTRFLQQKCGWKAGHSISSSTEYRGVFGAMFPVGHDWQWGTAGCQGSCFETVWVAGGKSTENIRCTAG